MWKKLFTVGLVILGMLGIVLVEEVYASAAPQTTSVPYPACFNKHPTLHVQISGHIAYECLGLGKTPIQGVGLYWSDNLYELNYYWHPGHGQMVVNETFFKSCPEVSQERHGAPCGLYAGVPMLTNAAGVDQWAEGRFIIMADGCVVDAPTDQGTVPDWCSMVITDGGEGPLPGHQMTTVEYNSAKGFWSIMNYYTPDKYW